MKKTAITIRLMISFLLIALTPSGVVVGQEAILDFYGKPVRSNTTYNILGGGGFVTARPLTLAICPSAMESSSTPDGALTAQNMFVSSSDIIRLTTKFKVKYGFPLSCGQTGFWYAALNEHVFLNGSGSSAEVESTFSFQKSLLPSTYKFVSGSGDLQGDIAVRANKDFARLLVLRKYNIPLSVTFFPV